jgi:hypothetical protein
MEPSIDAEAKALARSLAAAREGLVLATRTEASAHDADVAETQALALIERYRNWVRGLAEDVRERIERELEEPLERLKDELTRMCRL